MSTVSWTMCWKKIRGAKIHVAVDEYSIPPAIEVRNLSLTSAGLDGLIECPSH